MMTWNEGAKMANGPELFPDAVRYLNEKNFQQITDWLLFLETAMPLSASVTEETNIGKLETLTDNNRGTCQWIRGNSSLRLKYSKTYNITSVTVISPINTKGELNELT
jgi:hypothetical protein